MTPRHRHYSKRTTRDISALSVNKTFFGVSKMDIPRPASRFHDIHDAPRHEETAPKSDPALVMVHWPVVLRPEPGGRGLGFAVRRLSKITMSEQSYRSNQGRQHTALRIETSETQVHGIRRDNTEGTELFLVNPGGKIVLYGVQPLQSSRQGEHDSEPRKAALNYCGLGRNRSDTLRAAHDKSKWPALSADQHQKGRRAASLAPETILSDRVGSNFIGVKQTASYGSGKREGSVTRGVKYYRFMRFVHKRDTTYNRSLGLRYYAAPMNADPEARLAFWSIV
ncbi:hypothetical protein DL93DRAFT_2098600 [Clavulina sp. PMI_390]|nr:hypothetical protein DL93DRAFT_2098600 [Clavulina sp. PMI_390]